MGRTVKRKYDRYTLEFKLQAVNLAESLDVKAIDVANTLGIHPVMLYRWQMEHRRGVLRENKHMGKAKSSEPKPKKKPLKKPSKPKDEEKTRALEDKLAAAERRIKKLEQSLESRTEELDILKKAERFFAKKK